MKLKWLLKRKSTKEEIKRHTEFTKTFLVLYAFVLCFVYLFVRSYGFLTVVFSLTVFTISSFMPDILFVLLVMLKKAKLDSEIRSNTHKLSSAIVYSIFVSFLSAPFFGDSSFVIGLSSFIGYLLHLFVDRIENLVEFINRIVEKVLEVFK